MTATWQCGVCETVNHEGKTCSACGAHLSRRATVATSVRGRLTTPVPPPRTDRPLPEPVRRAINREPVPDREWEEYELESGYSVTPVPGGCIINMGPRTPMH